MRVCALVLAVLVAACGGSGATSTSPTPAPNPLSDTALKYRIVDQFGRLFFCDPDFYPVARSDEQSLADARFPDIQKDTATFAAILTHAGVPPAATYTAAQRLAVYRDWKMLNALRLDAAGGAFHFTGVFVGFGSPSTAQYTRVDGTIDQRGTITVASRAASGPPPCPICLARGTRIATPAGDVPVEDLRVGDIVWTTDEAGRRVAAPLVAVGSTQVPATHLVVHLVLSDGRSVDASPGHPTVDGRRVGDLGTGDAYDGTIVTSSDRVAYGGGATFDVLPSGASGAYWANGVLLGSTLH